MWPCKNAGEDARLYEAVRAVSDFAIELGINIPTGKDSLSMTQKYPDGKVVYSPGTVIISAVAEVSEVQKVISPVLVTESNSVLVWIDFSSDELKLGGSSFAQVTNQIGNEIPTIKNSEYFKKTFGEVQHLIQENRVMAGHDISAGGLITTMLEMTFANPEVGIEADLTCFNEPDIIKLLFSENPGVVLQMPDKETAMLPFSISGRPAGLKYHIIGRVTDQRRLTLQHGADNFSFDIDQLRDTWFKTSYLLDRKQCGEKLALERFSNYKLQPLRFQFPDTFTGKAIQYGIDMKRRESTGFKAAIIREKGVNRDRDMAWALYLGGFDVKDIHMTDLITGRENLEDVNFIAFVGGFSNSDVLGSAKGWAGAFLYNEKAKKALDNFFSRPDTLSLGVCNGCQLLVELGLIYPGMKNHPRMSWNDSHK